MNTRKRCPTCTGGEVACPKHPDPPHAPVWLEPNTRRNPSPAGIEWRPAPGDRVVYCFLEHDPCQGDCPGEVLRVVEGVACVRWESMPNFINTLSIDFLAPVAVALPRAPEGVAGGGDRL